jgi:hypothetical protein
MAEAEIPQNLRKFAMRFDYIRQMQRFPRAAAAAGLALLGARSALRDAGWFRSFATRLPVDAAGAPLPWFTYPAIALLGPRLSPKMRVFEYGAGYSTLWWAARVGAVRSVENDADWVTTLRPQLPHNAVITLAAELGGAYTGAAAVVAQAEGARFDVVVIDGRERNACVPAALAALATDGVIVWDNSERERYDAGQQVLTDAGFRRIDLHGMGPINPYGWCTSVFYRDGNCLVL